MIDITGKRYKALTAKEFSQYLKLNSMGFKSYITNNPIFFKKVILEEIKKYFK